MTIMEEKQPTAACRRLLSQEVIKLHNIIGGDRKIGQKTAIKQVQNLNLPYSST